MKYKDCCETLGVGRDAGEDCDVAARISLEDAYSGTPVDLSLGIPEYYCPEGRNSRGGTRSPVANALRTG